MGVDKITKAARLFTIAGLVAWALSYAIPWLTEPVEGCLRVDSWRGVWGGWFTWAFIAAELGIFVPYVWIPVSLGRVLRGRRDIPFSLLVALFGAFIFSCGLTHLVVFLTIFYPWYHLELALLAICATVSSATAYVLHGKVKLLVGLPPLEAVLRANEVLSAKAETLREDKEALQIALEKNAALVVELDRARSQAQERAQRAEGSVEKISAERDQVADHARELRELSEQLQHALTEKAAASERIDLQAAAIRELEAPIVPLWDGVLLLPLVGPVDSTRAQRLMENLLGAVVAHSARVVILDLTGVRVVDTAVAGALSMTAKAVKLVGSECVITGISGDIALTVVKLGLELGIETLRDVQQGLGLAMRRVSLRRE